MKLIKYSEVNESREDSLKIEEEILANAKTLNEINDNIFMKKAGSGGGGMSPVHQSSSKKQLR